MHEQRPLPAYVPVGLHCLGCGQAFERVTDQADDDDAPNVVLHCNVCGLLQTLEGAVLRRLTGRETVSAWLQHGDVFAGHEAMRAHLAALQRRNRA